MIRLVLFFPVFGVSAETPVDYVFQIGLLGSTNGWLDRGTHEVTEWRSGGPRAIVGAYLQGRGSRVRHPSVVVHHSYNQILLYFNTLVRQLPHDKTQPNSAHTLAVVLPYSLLSKARLQ